MEHFSHILLLAFLSSVHYLIYSSSALILVANPNTDRSSLVALKSHITSDPHDLLLKNWTIQTSVCNWIGVTCDPINNRVTELNISNMQLIGTIPPEIGNLSCLVSLDMNENSFYGPIPPSIFNIPSIQVITVRGNGLSSELPTDMCKHGLQNLKLLRKSFNKLYGEIPSSLGQCSRLMLLTRRTSAAHPTTGPTAPLPKVRKCNRSRSHDWTDLCLPGEKARRRDPWRFHYSGTVCSEFRKSHCGKGDAFEFSHGVFECWLHPSRYRTEACKDEKGCKWKVCFFAHSSRQLRIVPDSDLASPEKKSGGHHCCVYCHCSSMSASPTSTLMGHMAHNTSPPLSPLGETGGGAASSYRAELMASFEAMSPSPTVGSSSGLPWLDVNEVMSPGRLSSPSWFDVNFNVEDPQPQFVMSPSTPVRRMHSKFYSGESKFSPVGIWWKKVAPVGRISGGSMIF